MQTMIVTISCGNYCVIDMEQNQVIVEAHRGTSKNKGISENLL